MKVVLKKLTVNFIYIMSNCCNCPTSDPLVINCKGYWQDGPCINGQITRTFIVTAAPTNNGEPCPASPITIPCYNISGPNSVCVGGTIQLIGTSAGGTWSSNNANVTVVNGLVTGVSVGQSIITYGVSGNTDTHTVIVQAPIPVTLNWGTASCVGDSVTITSTIPGTITINGPVSSSGQTPFAFTFDIPGTYTATHTLFNGNNCPLTVNTYTYNINETENKIATINGPNNICVDTQYTSSFNGVNLTGGTWSSNDPNVATVSNGLVNVVNAGTFILNYTKQDGCIFWTGNKTITISDALPSPQITGTNSLCLNATATLLATPLGGIWNSANSNIVSVNQNGQITAHSVGTTIISYIITNVCGTQNISHSVTVTQTQSLTITGNNDICLGNTTTFTGTPSGGTWSSSNTTIATVNSAGVITSVSAGICNIIYTLNASCTQPSISRSLTINPIPNVEIIGNLSMCQEPTLGNIINSNCLACARVGFDYGKYGGQVYYNNDLYTFLIWTQTVGTAQFNNQSNTGTLTAFGNENTNQLQNLSQIFAWYKARAVSFISSTLPLTTNLINNWFLPSIIDLKRVESLISFPLWSSSWVNNGAYINTNLTVGLNNATNSVLPGIYKNSIYATKLTGSPAGGTWTKTDNIKFFNPNGGTFFQGYYLGEKVDTITSDEVWVVNTGTSGTVTYSVNCGSNTKTITTNNNTANVITGPTTLLVGQTGTYSTTCSNGNLGWSIMGDPIIAQLNNNQITGISPGTITLFASCGIICPAYSSLEITIVNCPSITLNFEN